MTATEKFVENKNEKTVYSMDDETVFGKCIDNKSVKPIISFADNINNDINKS